MSAKIREIENNLPFTQVKYAGAGITHFRESLQDRSVLLYPAIVQLAFVKAVLHQVFKENFFYAVFHSLLRNLPL